jgi:hypothetical protein
MAEPGRDDLLLLDDAALARHCRIARRLGTGPGGQKRNKTASAVLVTHESSGCDGAADDTRSQHQNLHLALRRLRLNMAGHWRQPPPAAPLGLPPTARAPDRWLWLARLFDVLEAHHWSLADSVTAAGLNTARIVKELADEPQLWQRANEARRQRGLPVLKC